MRILAGACMMLVAAISGAGEPPDGAAAKDSPPAGAEKAKGDQDSKKPFEQRLKEARAQARKGIEAGVEKALQACPHLPAAMKAQLRDKSTREKWVEKTLNDTRAQFAKMKKSGGAVTQENEEDCLLRSLATNFAEERVSNWLLQSLLKTEAERAKAEEAAKKAGKKKSGGENTPPPDGSATSVGVGGGIGITTP